MSSFYRQFVLTRLHQFVMKVSLESKSFVTNVKDEPIVPGEKVYFHPLDPVFPLSGDLKAPSPGFELGRIPKNADVVIGIPTVKRQGVSYLSQTIDSLLKNQVDRSVDSRILVYVGETDEEFLRDLSHSLQSSYQKHIEDGILQLISPPKSYYPPWEKVLQSSFNDALDRVKWRSKQNLDQIFLMMYIYNLSPKYYLMMEDDVIASHGYIGAIMKEANRRSMENYFYISFCNLGAIGKLFRAETLPSYASFIHTFWNKKPLDWLQLDYVASAVCSYDENAQQCNKRRELKMPPHKPSLFQHIGSVSSLQGKTQNLKDNSFKSDAI
ncbi:alpha-1,3-mannosyl-glycoprotein 4-beta-N-acetylglucosaminyltransferase A-like [Clavelina lepadiformis]|uniref:alpha-1,3-mannosyl-glycoprotein 4-beta-N-acetylglucosaminyltransferase A-like n=1 Tax=Clavelina lepadiformis TaxID=159417 RepID=UPI004042E0DE